MQWGVAVVNMNLRETGQEWARDFWVPPALQLSRAFMPTLSVRNPDHPGMMMAPSFHPMDVVEHPNHYAITAGMSAGLGAG